MKLSKVCWGLCATLLMSGAAQADRPDDPFGLHDESPRFMLYVHKGLGSSRQKSMGPSFGFAIGRASSANMFDLRVAPFDHGIVLLNGLQLRGPVQPGLGYGDSYAEGGSWSNPWVWFAAALVGAVGISCATDNWPCDDDSYGGGDDYTPPAQ